MKFYNDDNMINAIKTANNLTDEVHVEVGDKLLLP